MEKIYNGNSLKSGVYKIFNKLNGRIYIGSAKEFKRRSTEHLRSLKQNKHKNKFLQYDFNKCGEENFVFEVLEVVEGDKENRFEIEQKYVDLYHDNQDQCYNLKKKTIQKDRTCFSGNPEETKKLISENMTRIWSDPEYKKERTKKLKESVLTPEALKNRSKGQKEAWDNNSERKQTMSERSKKMIQNGLKEKLHNDESKQKRNEALKQYHIDRHKELCSKPIIETIDFIHQGIHCKTVLDANLLSPEGILYKNITNVQKFAECNNLSETKVRDLINGKLLSFKGWVKYLT